MPHLLYRAVVLAALALGALAAHAQPLETGRFILHKYKQPIGTEAYTVERSAQGSTIHADFKFTDRTTEVPLSADLALAADGSALRLALKGKTARINTVDLAAEAQADGVVHVRDGGADKVVPGGDFLLGSYAPVSFQQQLLRRWKALGRPASLRVPPLGTVRIRQSGTDDVGTRAQPRVLTRYVVEDVIWGQESIWLDARDNLVALIGLDAEFDHFEALREGDEALLGRLLAAATTDQLDNLTKRHRLPSAPAGVTAIVGALLVDGSGAAPVPDAVVLIRDGRIAAAGPRAKVRVPAGAHLVDARGKTLIPGLWDMHAHLSQVEWGPIYLAAGVTTARDMGNEFEYIVALKKALAGGALGPRLFTAGLIDGRSDYSVGVDLAATPAEGVALVRRYKQAGFDQVKVYSSVKPDVLAAIIQEAHRQSMRVGGHLPEGITLAQALALGMNEFSHVHLAYRGLTSATSRTPPGQPFQATDLESANVQALLQTMLRQHTVLDPTLALMELSTSTSAAPLAQAEPGVSLVAPQLAATYATGPASPERIARNQTMRAAYWDFVGVAHRAGVPVVAGTDQAVPGHSIHRELELYVDAGLTPMQALQAATSVPAKVMGQAKDSGTIAPGRRADLLLLNGNPLEDIRNTRRIATVYLAGRPFDPAPLWRMVGFQPPAP